MFSGTQDTGRTVKCNLSGCWESEAQKGRCVRVGSLGRLRGRETGTEEEKGVSFLLQTDFISQTMPTQFCPTPASNQRWRAECLGCCLWLRPEDPGEASWQPGRAMEERQWEPGSLSPEARGSEGVDGGWSFLTEQTKGWQG